MTALALVDENVTARRLAWHEVPHYWPQIEDYVGASLAEGSIGRTAADIYDMCLARQAVLWLAFDGDDVIAFEVVVIQDYPRARICLMLLTGGREMGRWLSFESDIVEWAKTLGCDAMEGFGRRGWKRAAAHLGWKEVWTMYRKML